MNTNSENPKVGKKFQELVQESLEAYFSVPFRPETAFPIGTPPKPHKFDCVSEDRTIVVECKCYTWTQSGNVPSGKMRGMNEAILYMNHLPDEATRILCMKKAVHPKRAETLADYYYRIYGHLLERIKIFEVDELGNIRVVKE